MSSTGKEPSDSWEKIAEEAQRALRERPSVSIRTRLIMGFGAWFVLSLAIAVFSMVNVSSIKKKLYFMEATQSYSFEIQQARRFEKNFFLYHTNLEDALEHVRKAKEILITSEQEMTEVVGRSKYNIMKNHLVKYENLLLNIKNIEERSGNHSTGLEEIESDLRKYGSEMVNVADQLVEKERRQVNSMLALSHKIPMVFLGLLGLLILFLAFFITRQMLAPLNRMMAATQRIAEGDFTPVIAKRRYNDEFGKLAMALNHMMQQLVRRHEQLMQVHKLKAVGTLTAGVAHELNNPLNNLILTSSALMEEYKELSDEECEDMINDLLNESDRAQKIVRKLLDFARESETEPEGLEVEELIDQTLQLADNQIKLANVKVKGEISSDLPQIYGDRQQLNQVFLNIILNALDSMPNGGTLNISVNNTEDREYVAIKFTDTGTGIPEHKLSEVFDPFYTSKKNGKGTGLGLSVSLGIVQKHGGDIKVSSKEGKGTTFTVLLPAAKIPATIPEFSS
ncbi:MAG: ATP-binding protein [bacterium]